MRTLNPYLLLVGFLLCSTCQITFAHGDLHERIFHLTVLIDQQPDSSALYLHRGELRLQHETYSSALRDFETCEEMGIRSDRLYTGLARCHMNLDNGDRALWYVDRILQSKPRDVKALRLKGHVLSHLEDYAEAAEHYEQVITYANDVFTENFVEASIAWEKDGSKFARERASLILLKGIGVLGDLYVFHQRLVDLYKKYGDLDKALSHQTRIIENSKRKEQPYYKRGLIHLKAGNFQSAKADFEYANQAIKRLPERLRSTTASKDLQEDISLVFQQLE